MSLSHYVLPEWSAEIINGVVISDKSSRLLLQQLNDDGVVEIIELADGIRINTSSFVGRVHLGDFNLHIIPKLDKLPLSKLLGYTYGLRDLKMYDKASFLLDSTAFFDILIFSLYSYIDELLVKGFIRGYVQKEDELSIVKGRIIFRQIAGCGGMVTATLPCRHFDREEDTELNRILLSGLRFAQNMAVNIKLKREIQRTIDYMSGFITETTLSKFSLVQADKLINRLTESYRPIIELLNILISTQAEHLDAVGRDIMLPGYFFDMNLFFETLVSKLLRTLPDEYIILDQYRLKGMLRYATEFNPLSRRSPTLRPDFAITKGGSIVKIIDAKYRNLWENQLPRNILYQMAMYALSGIANDEATVIYPVLTDNAVVQIIDVYHPLQDRQVARLKLQPINLNEVAELVSGDSKHDLSRYITDMVL